MFLRAFQKLPQSVQEKAVTLQKNILKEVPCLNKKSQKVIGYRTLAGEFSDLWCLMNTLLSCVIWNLLVLHALQLFKTYNSDLTFLKAKCWGKSQDFNTKGFSYWDYWIYSRSFSDKNFNCTAVEDRGSGSHRSEFQDKCLFDYFLSTV